MPLFRPLMFTCFLRDKSLCVSFRTLRVPDGASWIQGDAKLFGSASSLCSLQTEATALFFSEFSGCCFRLFFDLEAIPAGREEVGSIRWGTFGCSNVLLTMCLPGDARLIRLADRAELLSEESSVH